MPVYNFHNGFCEQSRKDSSVPCTCGARVVEDWIIQAANDILSDPRPTSHIQVVNIIEANYLRHKSKGAHNG